MFEWYSEQNTHGAGDGQKIRPEKSWVSECIPTALLWTVYTIHGYTTHMYIVQCTLYKIEYEINVN